MFATRENTRPAARQLKFRPPARQPPARQRTRNFVSPRPARTTTSKDLLSSKYNRASAAKCTARRRTAQIRPRENARIFQSGQIRPRFLKDLRRRGCGRRTSQKRFTCSIAEDPTSLQNQETYRTGRTPWSIAPCPALVVEDQSSLHVEDQSESQ